MQSTQILRAEHDAVLGVLGQLEEAVALAERGVPIPKDIFVDIQEFFSGFVDKCHHHKEESAVFGELGSRPDDQSLVSQLNQEHETGRRLARAYAEAVSTYVPGDVGSARRVGQAAGDYAAMLRQHIEEENTELFPAMEQAFAAEQDAGIAREFDRIELEEMGAGTHERFHTMIDSLPARIAPWKSARPA